MLRINNLQAGYNGIKILKGISLHLDKGEILALIGPNGAGKSTVIKTIYSIADQYNGKIFFNCNDISGLKTHQLIEKGISYVPQGRIVFSTMSVEENLTIGCINTQNRSIAEKRLNQIYSRFPILKKRRDSLAYTLSGGQQQMLAIGRALMQKPKVILMDEPSLGLSPKIQKEIFEIIKRLKAEGISVLLVEQNAKKAIESADRTILLENGRVALSGGPEILEDPKIRRIYLGQT